MPGSARSTAGRPRRVSIWPRRPISSLLDEEELALVKLAAQFPRIVEAAAQAHEPHRIAFYLGDLAAAFHAQWNRATTTPRGVSSWHIIRN